MSEYIINLDGELGMALAVACAGAGFAREEIVRCRDCKHVHHCPDWQPDKRFKPKDIWICEAEWCMGFEGDHPLVEPDGFCKWGERRGDCDD